MAKNNATIKIGSDTKEAESGIKKITGEINKLSKQINRSGIRKLTDSFNSFTRAGSVVTGAMKKVNAALNECAELYNKQAKAETLLETAAKNNPYLNDVSVKQLKEFAGQLQNIGTVGDEELLPFMAQLASAGRTQSEIQQIMSAALDISAAGVMSMESAVKNLNKTFSGLSGELGENIPQIKELTTDQLKHGDAVKIVADQYRGMSKATTEKTGGWIQFKNTMGDLKEVIGSGFASAKNSAGSLLNSFLSSVVSGLSSANKEAEDFKKKIKAIADSSKDDASASTIENAIALITEERDKYQKQLDNLSVSEKDYTAKTKKEFEDFAKGADGYEQTVNKLAGSMSTLQYNINNYSQYEAYIPKEYRKSLAELQLEYDRTKTALAKYKEENEATYNSLKDSYKNSKKDYKDLQEANRTQDKSTLEQRIADANKEIEAQQKLLAEAQKRENAEASAEQKRKSKEDADKKATEAKAKYYDTVNKTVQAQQHEAETAKLTGAKLDELTQKQELLNSMVDAYVTAREEAGSTISDQNTFVQTEIEKIKKLASEIDKLKNNGANLPAFSYSNENLSVQEMIEEQEAYRQVLESLQAETEEGSDAWNKYAEAIKVVDSIIKELKGNMSKDWGDLSVMEKLEFANQQVQSLISSFNEAASLMSETIENQASADTSALEAQYEKGLISEEEYYAQKEKIEKKAAQKKYKIQLAEWALNLLATQSASALAIANSLKEGGTLGMVQAAIMGVQTAVQLASQIASKPLPPSYETGGVVGGFSGATLGEDNTYIHARRGEMMLNASQQKNLYDIANKGGASYSNNIFVKNEAGDTTRASASVTPDGVQITIKKIVNDAMARGEFNNSYAVMKSNIYGRRITN